MCLFNSQPQPAPQLPPETAAMKQPDGAAIKSAAQRRTGERTLHSPTILTSGHGVTQRAASDKPGLIPTILTSAANMMNFASPEKKSLLGA